MVALIIVCLCLFINAILSCAEMAFVSVDKHKLHKKSLSGDRRARIIEKMQELPERLLSVVQIGITLVGAVSAAVSGALAGEKISPWIMSVFDLKESTAETLSITLVVVPLTLLTVILGELVPKSIALRYSFPIILQMARGLKLTENFLGKLVTPLERATKFFLQILLPKEIEKQVIEAHEELNISGLKQEHKQYIFNLIDLDAKTVHGAMRSWDEVDVLDYGLDSQMVLEKILDTGRTRLPVIMDGEVAGFLHAKEFLNLFRSGGADSWVNFIRTPVFVKSHDRLLDVLKMMQKRKIHLLIVGSGGHPEGLLTLEDVIEEVIGDIIDEDEEKRIERYFRSTRSPGRIRLIHNNGGTHRPPMDKNL